MRAWYEPMGTMGVRISEEHLAFMAQELARCAPFETGGILVGLYESNTVARVTAVYPAPVDSKASLRDFWRGTDGLREILDRHWAEDPKTFYLGEWHTHPGAMTILSQADIDTMLEMAESKAMACPEPLLIVVGGGLDGAPASFGVNLFKGGERLILREEREYRHLVDESEVPFRRIDQVSFSEDPPERGGFCWEACLASLLGCALDEVPAFTEGDWQGFYMSWVLERFGRHLTVLGMADLVHAREDYGILVGRSPRNDEVDHSVIRRRSDGAIVHDPHPSRSGIHAAKYLVEFRTSATTSEEKT